MVQCATKFFILLESFEIGSLTSVHKDIIPISFHDFTLPLPFLPSPFRIIKAEITPGTHPRTVRSRTMRILPQPLSYTASGGNRIERRTRQIVMLSADKVS